jgi:hypothetical protein
MRILFPLAGRRRRLGRRGSVAAILAACSIALFGSAALAVDIGVWYLSMRNARNAADAAALAGAAAAATYGEAQGRAAAAAIAAANGFAHGVAGASVTVNLPPTGGAQAGNAQAVEVLISQQQRSFFSRLVHGSAPTVVVRAVGMRVSQGEACVLALGGTGLEIGGNSTVVTPGCVLASNRAGSDSVRLYGSAVVTAESIQAAGECDGCGIATLTEPFRQYQPPSQNPFAALDALTMPPSVNCASQPNFSGSNKTQTYLPSIPASGSGGGTITAYCSTAQLSNGDTLNLQPGIYYFWNSSLRVSGGTIRCPTCVEGTNGVTIVFTGSNVGQIGTARMDGNGQMRLFAGPGQPISAYNGVLFHRDIRATSDSGFSGTVINGGSNTYFAGGMYFPSSTVSFNGNMATGPNPCTVLVAQSISVSGSSATTLDNSGCSRLGTASAMTRLVRLTE